MRVLAAVGLMVALSGCAALPPVRESAAAPAPVQVSPHAPRRSQQELLAAYWTERRMTRPVFEIFDPGARSTDSGELQRMEDDRTAHNDAARRDAAQREEVRQALHAALQR